MRKIIALALGCTLLAGCDSATEPDPRTPVVQVGSIGVLRVHKIEVSGRLISCVVAESTSNAGVSCDFTREATP